MAAAESHSDPESLVVKLALRHFSSEERQPNVTEAPGSNLASERGVRGWGGAGREDQGATYISSL